MVARNNWVTQNIPGVVEYLSGDPKGPGFDPSHGSVSNYHEHVAWKDSATARRAKKFLEDHGIQVTEFGARGGHATNSLHYTDQAFDIPGAQWGGKGAIGDVEFRGSSRVRQLLARFAGLNLDDGGTYAGIDGPAPQQMETITAPSDWRASSGTNDQTKAEAWKRQDLAMWAQANPELAKRELTRRGLDASAVGPVQMTTTTRGPQEDFGGQPPKSSWGTPRPVGPENRGALSGTTVGGPARG